MVISLNWLREYVDLPADAAILAERLTLSGTEVERVVTQAAEFEGVVVAEIVGLRPHPNGGTNQLARITTGAGSVEVVTGAPNLAPGDRVPFAPVGATIKGQRMTARVIRGVRSEGMLCSPLELGLGEDPGGILILDRSASLGSDLKTLYPPDILLVLEVKSNRPDLLSHLGVAREVATLFGAPLRPPTVRPPTTPRDGGLVTIEAPDGCRRFVGRLLTGVQVAPSPPWMQARLRAVGVRPISNVVDVTNYVMLESGQPMHAFDYARLKGGRVVVRRARPGERLLALDGKPRDLRPDFMVVADVERPQALAGIIGGAESAVEPGTSTVLLEAATWEPRGIRSVSRALGLRTEASTRFEKGLSPALSQPAVDRAAALLRELAQGRETKAADVYPAPFRPAAIELSGARLDRTLGLHVPLPEAVAILERLEFRVDHTEDRLRVTPPLVRLDCSIPEDVIEEVGRIYGYNRVPSTLPGERTPVRDVYQPTDPDERTREVLAGAGFDEAVTYPLVDPKTALLLRLPIASRRLLKVQNPTQENRNVLRVSLLPGLLESLAVNVRQDQPGVRLFELAAGFWGRNGAEAPQEPLLLALVAHLPRDDHAGAARELRTVEGLLSLLRERVARRPTEFSQATDDGFHPGRTAAISEDGDLIGVVGEVHPAVLAQLNLPGRVVAGEVLFDRFVGAGSRTPRVVPPPRFPGVRRDLTVIVRGRVAGRDLAQVIRELGGYTLREVSMQSEYEGSQLGPGARSLSFRLQYQADDRTMTSEEVSALQQRIVDGLKKRFGAEVRE